jgi:hypothetical protein
VSGESGAATYLVTGQGDDTWWTFAGFAVNSALASGLPEFLDVPPQPVAMRRQLSAKSPIASRIARVPQIFASSPRCSCSPSKFRATTADGAWMFSNVA